MVDEELLPHEDALRARFDHVEPLTVGLEEEILLLDPRSHAPVPVADDVVRSAGRAAIKRELPSCQVELMTAPHPDPGAAVGELVGLRRALTDVCNGSVVPAAAAVHPFAPVTTGDGSDDRYRRIHDAYGEAARRQVVGALQVHVAVGTADRTLAVYNALRGYLPEIAAVAASAPFHEGRDTGLASIRPLVCAQLPRQGVPPVLTSWAHYADELRWGAVSGAVPEPRQWWWELRPHVVHGTLELRVPDVQATTGAAEAVARLAHGLVRSLSARYDDGQELGAPPTWRIAENRWNALRRGTDGSLADLSTGEATPTRRRLHQLVDELEPFAPEGLEPVRKLVERTGAEELRVAGIDAATTWLVDGFNA